MHCFNIKFNRSIPIIGTAKSIDFFDEKQLVYTCQISRSSKRNGIFELYDSNNSLTATVEFLNKLRDEFIVQDHLSKLMWEYSIPRSNAVISIAPEYCFLKANETELKVLDQSDWKLILDGNERIGRLTTESEHPLKSANWKIIIDNNQFSTLLKAFALAVVIQHKVFKIYEPND
ncbi:MAG: hypothetical protein RIC03_00130 [Cyclobacteriaceae bacterium]